MPTSPDGVVRLLLSRLTDATLAAVAAGLASGCDSRPGCARLLSIEQRTAISHTGLPRDESSDAFKSGDRSYELKREIERGGRRARSAHSAAAHTRLRPDPFARGSDEVTVRGTDVLFGKWSLLFATPFYQATLPEHEALNSALLTLLDAERRSLPSGASGSRSLVGNGWRTDDSFLQRTEAPIRKLHKLLLEHSRLVVQYGQTRKLDLELYLSGWAGESRSQPNMPHAARESSRRSAHAQTD